MRTPNIIRWLRHTIWLAILIVAVAVGIVWVRPGREDLPWTPLVLSDPVGLSTGRKIGKLTADREGCIALLESSGLAFDALEPRGEDQCRVEDGVRIAGGQDLLALNPSSVTPSCPVTIGLLIWQSRVVQPQAQAIFGARVARIETFGSFSCRRMYGRGEGAWSEHATADAIDISGFVLTDGRRISVQQHWSAKNDIVGDSSGADDRAVFLKTVRDGACDLFSTVLSPDYNAAHNDHLHIDLANRGDMGWRACR